MSLSWSKHFSKTSIGIAVGAKYVTIAQVSRRNQNHELDWMNNIALPEALFNIKSKNTETILTQALSELCQDYRKTAIPIYLSLPNPVFITSVFEMDELPKTDQTIKSYIEWRFNREHHLENQSITCAYQYLGLNHQDKHLMLGLAIPNEWLGAVKAACHAAHIMPRMISMDICYRLNRFYDIISKKENDGMFISINKNAWAVLVLDHLSRMRFIRSRWRQSDTENDYDSIKLEIERVARSYVNAAKGRKLTTTYITGTSPDVEILEQKFEQHFACSTCKFSKIPDDHHLIIKGDPQQISDTQMGGVLAAAIGQ